MSWVMLLVALLLIYLEFFLPGGVMGTAGAILVIASVVFSFTETESVYVVLTHALAALVGLVVTIKLALLRIRSTKDTGSIYSEGDQEGYKAASFDESLVGSQGKAASDLGLSGYVTINNQRFQALSKLGYIKKGSPIEVIGGEGAHLIVKVIEE